MKILYSILQKNHLFRYINIYQPNKQLKALLAIYLKCLLSNQQIKRTVRFHSLLYPVQKGNF